MEIGKPFIERLNGWPLDVVGYVGLMRHYERNVQPDFWQLNACMKGLWYGFRWSNRVLNYSAAMSSGRCSAPPTTGWRKVRYQTYCLRSVLG